MKTKVFFSGRCKRKMTFAENKLKVRMRRKVWRPLVMGVRSFGSSCMSLKERKKNGTPEG